MDVNKFFFYEHMEENFVWFGMGKTKRGDEQAICKCNVKRLGHDFALLHVLLKNPRNWRKKLLLLIDFSHCFHDARVWNTNTSANNLLCFCFLGALIKELFIQGVVVSMLTLPEFLLLLIVHHDVLSAFEWQANEVVSQQNHLKGLRRK